jgi:hypothetical protein
MPPYLLRGGPDVAYGTLPGAGPPDDVGHMTHEQPDDLQLRMDALDLAIHMSSPCPRHGSYGGIRR